MNPDDFLKLAAAGLSTDQIALVMEMMARDAKAYAEAEEARKEKGRARVAKWRLERQRNVTETSPKVTVRLTRVEDKTSTTQIEPQEKKTSHSDVAAFRAGLAPDVSEEVLAEFVKVRRKKRGALTGFAAKLFREDAMKCGMSVAEAAKECIRSSWITVKPEYFTGRQRAGPGPAPPKDTPANAARRRLEEMQNERRNGSETDDHQPAAGVIPGNLIRLVG